MTFFVYTQYVKTYSTCFISRDIDTKFLIGTILKNNQNTIGGAMAVASYPSQEYHGQCIYVTNIIFLFPNVNLDLKIKLAILHIADVTYNRCRDLYYSFVISKISVLHLGNVVACNECFTVV